MTEKKLTINIINEKKEQLTVFLPPNPDKNLDSIAWRVGAELQRPDSKQFNWHIDPVLTYPTEPKKLDQDQPAFKDGKFVFQLPLSAIKPESE